MLSWIFKKKKNNNLVCCNSFFGDWIAADFFSCHGSTLVMSCIKFCSVHFINIDTSKKKFPLSFHWNFKKSLVKWVTSLLVLNSLRPSDAYMHQQTNHHWFRKWLVAWPPPSHYLNQCWDIVNWTLRNKLQWNLNQNPYIFIQENVIESVDCENGGHLVLASMC